MGIPRATRCCASSPRRSRAVLREIDLAARWGGEEFAVLPPGTDVQGGITSPSGCEARSPSGSSLTAGDRIDDGQFRLSPNGADPQHCERPACSGGFRSVRGETAREEPRRGWGLPRGRWRFGQRTSRYNPPLDHLRRHSQRGRISANRDTFAFADVIQDHLELKRKNSEIEPDLPIDRYKAEDPFDNHPVQERGASPNRRDHGRRGIAAVRARQPGCAEPEQPTDEDTLWGRSRDFDWGD